MASIAKKPTARRAGPIVGSGRGKKASKKSIFGKLNKWVALVAFVVVFGGIGSYFVFFSHAATYTSSVYFGDAHGGSRVYHPGYFVLQDDQYARCKLAFLSNGNFVFYNRYGTAKWSSGTTGKVDSNGFLYLRWDGNIMIYDVTNNIHGTQKYIVWQSHTAQNLYGAYGDDFFSLDLHSSSYNGVIPNPTLIERHSYTGDTEEQWSLSPAC